MGAIRSTVLYIAHNFIPLIRNISIFLILQKSGQFYEQTTIVGAAGLHLLCTLNNR